MPSTFFWTHHGFVEEGLSNVVSKVENIDSENFNQSLSKVLSKVEGENFDLVLKLFVALQKITHPHPIQTPFWGYGCVDNCKTINIFLHLSSWLQPVVPYFGKLTGAENKKTLTIFMIISVFLCVSGSFYPVESGAAGIRTLVQTSNWGAFYMLIPWLVVGAALDADTQGCP